MSHLPDVYATISIDDLNKIDFSQVGETSENTIRKSLDLTQFVIKYESEHEPTFIADGLVLPIQVLTHEEAIELMQTAEWQEPMPE